MSKINKIVKRCIFGIISVGTLLSLIVLSLIMSEFNSTATDSDDKQFAIVLGCALNGSEISERLKVRLDTAFDYLKDKNLPIILSGGKGDDEIMSEAQAMKLYLIQRGIKTERLILEDRSTSTYENLLFSKEIMKLNNPQILIITSDYHMYRAKRMAKRLGFEIEGISAKNRKMERVKRVPREILALVKELFLPN